MRLHPSTCAGVALALMALIGCGDARYEADAFSFEPAAGWEVADEGESAPLLTAPNAASQRLVSVKPTAGDSGLAQVDIYGFAMPPAAAGVDDAQMLSRMVSELERETRADGGELAKPRPAQLGGVDGAEVDFAIAPIAGVTPQGRLLFAPRDRTAYLVVQAGIDPAELAEYAVGFDAVVDSWEWE